MSEHGEQLLMRKIEALERIVGQMGSRLNLLDHPLRDVFLAKNNGGGKFQEQTVINGSITDFAGARVSSGTHPSNFLMAANDTVALLEVRDGNDYRYVQLSSPPGILLYPFKVLGTAGYGKYTGSVLGFVDATSSSEALDLSAETVPTSESAVLYNAIETGKATNHIPTNEIVIAWKSSIKDSSDLAIYYTIWEWAIRRIRWNSSTRTIQVTYSRKDFSDLVDGDWEDAINTIICP